MIKAVLFDAAGVLTGGYTHVVAASAVAMGADLDALAGALLPVFAGEADTDSTGHRLERGEVPLEEFLSSLGPVEADARAVLHPDSPHFFGHRLAPEPSMMAFVDEVRASGRTTAVVSNTVREWHSAWRKAIGPLDRFDEVLFSADEGVRKPDPVIYERALGRLGVAPSEALFLDDFAPMAEGARRVGIAAVDVLDHATAIAEARVLLGST